MYTDLGGEVSRIIRILVVLSLLAGLLSLLISLLAKTKKFFRRSGLILLAIVLLVLFMAFAVKMIFGVDVLFPFRYPESGGLSQPESGRVQEAIKSPSVKIISSEVTSDETCRVKATTTGGDIYLKPSFPKGTKCYQFLLNQVSNSGKYLAYEDLSGGIDSMVKIYSADLNESFQLVVLGTSTILDMKFLPDDRLAVLSGYPGSYDEQFLNVYNIPVLFANLSKNIDPQYRYFINYDENGYHQKLPEVGQDYKSLVIQDGYLRIFSSQGVNSKPLRELKLSEL